MSNRDQVSSSALPEADAAALLEVSARTLRRWAKQGCPRAKASAGWVYDLAEVEIWLASRAAVAPTDSADLRVDLVADGPEQPATDGGESYRSARTRRERAAADILQSRASALRQHRDELEAEVARLRDGAFVLRMTLEHAFPRALGAMLLVPISEFVGMEPTQAVEAAIRRIAADELHRFEILSLGPLPADQCHPERRREAVRRALKTLDEHVRPTLVAIVEGREIQ